MIDISKVIQGICDLFLDKKHKILKEEDKKVRTIQKLFNGAGNNLDVSLNCLRNFLGFYVPKENGKEVVGVLKSKEWVQKEQKKGGLLL